MAEFRRIRMGALLGAFAGPPIVILFLYPLFEPSLLASVHAKQVPVLVLILILASWLAGVVGLPILGACVVSGAWLGRVFTRRLGFWCVGGGMAGGLLSGILLRAGVLKGGEGGGAVLRLLCIEAGLVGAVTLFFRKGKYPPPA